MSPAFFCSLPGPTVADPMPHVFVVGDHGDVPARRLHQLRGRFRSVRPVFEVAAGALVEPGQRRGDRHGEIVEQVGVAHQAQHPERKLLGAAEIRQVAMRRPAGHRRVEIDHDRARHDHLRGKRFLRRLDEALVVEEGLGALHLDLAGVRPEDAIERQVLAEIVALVHARRERVGRAAAHQRHHCIRVFERGLDPDGLGDHRRLAKFCAFGDCGLSHPNPPKMPVRLCRLPGSRLGATRCSVKPERDPRPANQSFASGSRW